MNMISQCSSVAFTKKIMIFIIWLIILEAI